MIINSASMLNKQMPILLEKMPRLTKCLHKKHYDKLREGRFGFYKSVVRIVTGEQRRRCIHMPLAISGVWILIVCL